MPKLYRVFLLPIALCLAAVGSAQQDPMFTKYVFNGLIFNPAYAGSKDHLIVNLLHRSQWVGLEGAPTTQSFSAHSPLRNQHVALGFSLVNDQIGATGTTDLSADYAYRIKMRNGWQWSLGVRASLANWRSNWNKLNLEDIGDDAFNENLSTWLPNFGAGAYVSNERYYLGFGSPRLVEYNLRKAATGNDAIYARTYRHYYATAGAAFRMTNQNVIFRPSLLLKSTGFFSSFRQDALRYNVGSPTQISVDAAFFFFESLWVGGAFRTALEGRRSSSDSADLYVTWYLRNGLRVGAAYDLLLSDIRRAAGGSFELMLGYEFDVKIKRVATPRYF